MLKVKKLFSNVVNYNSHFEIKQFNHTSITVTNINKTNSKLYSNSIGHMLNDARIDSPPYKLKRCDQVVFIAGERFSNYSNYFIRDPTYFEINIYSINMYDDETPDSLIDSIDLWSNDRVPKFIMGSGNCLDVIDENANKRFPICTKSIEEIQQVFLDFYMCRKGNSIGDPLRTILKLCADSKKNRKNNKVNFI